jgi:hypothetical protein
LGQLEIGGAVTSEFALESVLIKKSKSYFRSGCRNILGYCAVNANRGSVKGDHMRKWIAAALCIVSNGSFASPQKPTFLETAVFLLSGDRADKFERIADRTLFRKLPGTESYYEYYFALRQDEKNCRVLHLTSSDRNHETNNDNAVNRRTVYSFHMLNGERHVSPILPITANYEEVMEGEKATCRVHHNKQQRCKDNISNIVSDAQELEQRARAWRYLFGNFCPTSAQLF